MYRLVWPFLRLYLRWALRVSQAGVSEAIATIDAVREATSALPPTADCLT